MRLSNICCFSAWMGDRFSIASCIGSMHEPCVGLEYFRLRPVCLRLIPLVQFKEETPIDNVQKCHSRNEKVKKYKSNADEKDIM